MDIHVVTENQWPPGRAIIDPTAIILLEVHYTMFHAKYVTSSICQFREADYLKFFLYTYKENLWPPRVGLILTLETKF
jgi:hypothetical protein